MLHNAQGANAQALVRAFLEALAWFRRWAVARKRANSRSTSASIRSCCGFGKSGRNLGKPRSPFCPNHSSSCRDDSSLAVAHFMAKCKA